MTDIYNKEYIVSVVYVYIQLSGVSVAVTATGTIGYINMDNITNNL